jgi:hypothetical protein
MTCGNEELFSGANVFWRTIAEQPHTSLGKHFQIFFDVAVRSTKYVCDESHGLNGVSTKSCRMRLHSHLDLSFDQVRVHRPIPDPTGHTDEQLSLGFRLLMSHPLRFRLELDTLHHKRVEVEQRALDDRLVGLEDEDHGDGALNEDFG